MTPHSTNHTRTQALTRLLRRGKTLATQGARVSERFSRWRLGLFLLGAILCVGLYQQAWFHAGNATLFLFLIGFLTVTWFHQRLKFRLQRLDRWFHLKKELLARGQLDWPNIPSSPHIAPDHHPFSLDLDLTGTHSLLHLIDTTFSTHGQTRLQTWLFQANEAHPSDFPWPERQSLIQELTPLSRLRDRCRLETHAKSPSRLDASRLNALLAEPIAIPRLFLVLLVASGLIGLTIALLLFTLVTGFPNFWLLSLIAYAGLYFYFSGTIHPLFGRVLALHVELEKLVKVMNLLEKTDFSHQPRIQQLCQPFLAGPVRPSFLLKRLGRICQGLSVKAHPLIHLGLNIFLPWDLFLIRRLQHLLSTLQDTLPQWLEKMGTFDAASALARFAYLNPEYQWPRLEPADKDGHAPGLSAQGLGHPLIAPHHRIHNDIELRGPGHILIITGSNMSGKSTFLRTVGINLCLAQAGGPVCASEFSWTWLHLYCCIRVTDALDEGLSYFYAEVKRLKTILDAVQDPNGHKVLFLIDEIYRGTNNRERLGGSQAFVQSLQPCGSLGMISTHDLELTHLADSLESIQNAHFQESIANGTMHFDYRLRPGPCPTTNALRIMAQEGLPIPSDFSSTPPADPLS